MFSTGSSANRVPIQDRLDSIGRRLAVGIGILILSGCTVLPFKQVTSLSPSIKGDAIAYNDTFGYSADRILLSNVIRSKNHEPLNLSQLSSLSGSLSLQGTAGFTIPWGPSATPGQNSAMPSIQGSTSPTYSMTPLNTQGFMLNILQPVSAAYVLNRWQAGLSREMLLLLFVKEIDLPSPQPSSDVTTPLTDPKANPPSAPTAKAPPSSPDNTDRYINDPDDPGRFAKFLALLKDLVAANAELKSFDILDPVGPTFNLLAGQTSSTSSGSTTAGTTTATSTNADSTGFSEITSANDGQYHVGNIKNVGKDATGAAGVGGQLYRVYSGQVAVCVNPDLFKNYKVPMIDNKDRSNGAGTTVPRTSTDASQALGRVIVQGVHFYSMNVSGMQPSTTTGQGAGKTGSASASAGAPTGGSASQALTAALQASRVSAVVDSDGCKSDEIVLDPTDEHGFADNSAKFIHVQWRSVSEIFDYLGAMLRMNEQLNATQPSVTYDKTVTKDANGDFDFAVTPDYSIQGTVKGKPETLFSIHQRSVLGGPVSVSDGFAVYGVNDMPASDVRRDNTLTTLSMLNTLVDLSSQATTGPSSSQPLRLLPIP